MEQSPSNFLSKIKHSLDSHLLKMLKIYLGITMVPCKPLLPSVGQKVNCTGTNSITCISVSKIKEECLQKKYWQWCGLDLCPSQISCQTVISSVEGGAGGKRVCHGCGVPLNGLAPSLLGTVESVLMRPGCFKVYSTTLYTLSLPPVPAMWRAGSCFAFCHQ